MKYFCEKIKTNKIIRPQEQKGFVGKFDIIPVSHILRRIYERKKPKRGVRSRLDGKRNEMKYLRFYTIHNPSKERLETFREQLQNEPEWDIIERAMMLKWLKVTKILTPNYWKGLFLANNIMFDFEIDKNKNLVTDGFLSHNSRLTHLAIHQLEEFGVIDPIVLAKRSGHSNINMLLIYSHIGSQYLKSKRLGS
jgi:hypothetical protein